MQTRAKERAGALMEPVEGFIERGRGRIVASAVVIEVVLPFCQKQRTEPPFGLGHEHIHKNNQNEEESETNNKKKEQPQAGNQKEIGKLNHDRYGLPIEPNTLRRR